MREINQEGRLPALPQWAPVEKEAGVSVPVSATPSGCERDYNRACVGTACCGVYGALGTYFCCNTFRGRAGAATACAVMHGTKFILAVVFLGLTLAAGCHMKDAPLPEQVAGLKYTWDITPHECNSAGGQWRERSPLRPWCSGACPTGYVHRSNTLRSSPEHAEYCITEAMVGYAEPVPPPQFAEEGHQGWWAKLWHHWHHHHGHHEERHRRVDNGGTDAPPRRQHPGPPTPASGMPRERMEAERYAGMERDEGVPATSQRPEPKGMPGQLPKMLRPFPEHDDDGDDAGAEFFMRLVMLGSALGFALLTTFFLALRRHWLRRAAAADVEQPWVVLVSPPATAPETLLL